MNTKASVMIDNTKSSGIIYNRKSQYCLKQVSVGIQTKLAVLQFRHAFCNGETEAVTFGVA